MTAAAQVSEVPRETPRGAAAHKGLRRQPAEIAAEIAAALMRGPKTRPEIIDMLGMSMNHSAQIEKYLLQFRASGCLYRDSINERGEELLAWQPLLFSRPDAPDSGGPWARRHGRACLRRVAP